MSLRKRLAAALFCLVMAGGMGAGIYAAVTPAPGTAQPAQRQPDISHITSTTRQPTCLQLEQEYGDDGLCARH